MRLKREVRQLRDAQSSREELFPDSSHISSLVGAMLASRPRDVVLATVYTVDDCVPVRALSGAAERGVTVRILLDSSKTVGAACNSTEAAARLLLDAGAELRKLSRRSAAGEPSRFPGALHAKSVCWCPADGHGTGQAQRGCLFMGSHNWTTASSANHELMARLTHAEVLRGYESWFDGIWSRGSPLQDVPARRRLRGKQSVAAVSTG